jgi:hypothetical protein
MPPLNFFKYRVDLVDKDLVRLQELEAEPFYKYQGQ